MKLEIDVNKVKFREMVDFEKITGEKFTDLKPGMTPSAIAMQGLIWITQRKVEPGFTFEDAGELEIGEIDFVMEAPADPTRAGADSGPAATTPTSDISRSSRTSTGSRRRNSGI